jgi:DNA polymerase-1
MGQSLYLIDGHAQIYRAYYAVMGLRSPTGEPTNATFNFVQMLLKLLQLKPTYVMLTMDAGTSGRDLIQATYKAQRKPMPDDMPVQIDRIRQIVETIGIPVFRQEGYEADDVLATLVRRVRNDPARKDAKIFMCTKDKDLDQLIDDGTPNGYAPCVMYDIQNGEEMTPAGLLAKKGYSPNQARDVLALTGDTADNIPGIPGVGPKTAAKWIAQYGSLDNLIAHKEDLAGKIGETFRNNLAILDNSRKMVELQFDVPIPPIDWHAATVHPEKLPTLGPIFHQLGFTRLPEALERIIAMYRDMMPPSVSAPPRETPSLAPHGNAGQNVPPTPITQDSEPTVRAAKSKIKTPKSKIMPSAGLFDQLVENPAAPEPATTTATRDLPPDELHDDALLNLTPTPSLLPTGLSPVVGNYQLVNTPEKLDAMLATLREQLREAQAADPLTAWLAVDTETDALGSMVSHLCGISLSAKPGTGFYVAVKGAVQDVLDENFVRQKLAPLLNDPAIKKVGQNLKYDLNALRLFGLPLAGIDFDTMVASYVIDSSRLSHGMDALAADYLQLKPIPISDLIGSGKSAISFADVPLTRAAQYSSEDADVTLRLAHALHPKLAPLKAENLFHDLEMPLVQVLADMEFHGVRIDTALLKKLSGEIQKKLEDLQVKIKAAAGKDFNQDSPKQLADILFTHLKLPIIKRTKTGPSTDITVLEKLSDKHPVPALIVEYRSLAKLKNTYLDTLASLPNPRTSRVHAHFNQTVAETGRLSSSDPNLQNIPVKTELGREIRRAFIASPGHVLISADYSQIELRMLAHYCGEKPLIEAFANNRDVHRMVAAELNAVPEDQVTPEMRAIAKTVNFGIIYGQTGFGLSQVLKIPQQQADAYITAYRRRFPAIEQFTHECIQQASMYGFVTTISGRRRALPDINSPVQARRQFSQRAAMNSVIQGSAADLIKVAMVNIHQKIHQKIGPAAPDNEIKMIIQIHDELVFEVTTESAEKWSKFILHEMENAMTLRVPLKVDLGTGPNWVEM